MSYETFGNKPIALTAGANTCYPNHPGDIQRTNPIRLLGNCHQRFVLPGYKLSGAAWSRCLGYSLPPGPSPVDSQ